ncbi:hypothetical protein HYV31_03190 [candidate division WWE3 bacterium]|nr:hypothetical protein [candidate division WWE3 bacterium]
MHPILIIVLVLNVFAIITIKGLFGVLITGGVVAVLYNVLARDGRPASSYRATLVAFGAVYFIACYSIIKAPWSIPEIDAAALILEIFIFAIFAALGKR